MSRTHTKLLDEEGYSKHGFETQDPKQWRNGDYYTNKIEWIWASIKRGIKGTYIKVAEKYIQRYLDEPVYRYNYMRGDTECFNDLLKNI